VIDMMNKLITVEEMAKHRARHAFANDWKDLGKEN
jgi:hypothetical protein